MSDDHWTERLQHLLDLANAGDSQAREALIGHAMDRLRALAHVELAASPRLRRWEETDDLLQKALCRLHRALDDVPVTSPPEFIGLAALQMRQLLIDLSRHLYGPQGFARNHDTGGCGDPAALEADTDDTNDPVKLAQWTEFHEQIERLPPEHREMFDLLFYLGWDTEEVAAHWKTSRRTVQRRWIRARLALGSRWNGLAAFSGTPDHA